jgi:hypothetical protein
VVVLVEHRRSDRCRPEERRAKGVLTVRGERRRRRLMGATGARRARGDSSSIGGATGAVRRSDERRAFLPFAESDDDGG